MSALDIFSGITNDDGIWTRYHAEVQVRDKLIGGTPKDPDTIKKWLAARLEMDDRLVLELADEVADQMQADRAEQAVTLEADLAFVRHMGDTQRAAELEGQIAKLRARPAGDELIDAIARKSEAGNGFKSIDGQLVYEGRCMKSALKESANIVHPGSKWPGKTDIAEGFRKGLLSTFSERVFIPELHLPLGVTQPSGTEQRIKHIMTPQGPRSAINVVDYVEKPRISFTVLVFRDFLKTEVWAEIWQLAEEIGIGADRARSDGKFDLLAWERVGVASSAKVRSATSSRLRHTASA